MYLLFALFTISFFGQAQSVKDQFSADSIFIYKNFKDYGTTARLWYNHRQLEITKAPKIKLSNADLNELVDIFKTVPRRKLVQQKYGGEICYLIVYDKGQKKRFALWTSLESGAIDDLDSRKRWGLRNTESRKRFHELISKYWL